MSRQPAFLVLVIALLAAMAGLSWVPSPPSLVAASGPTEAEPVPPRRLSALDVPPDLTWTSRAALPVGRYYLGVVSTPNGKVYALGGITLGGAYLDRVDEYDPVANTWTQKASMPTARRNLAAVALPDGTIYAFGGRGPDPAQGGTVDYLPSVERFDPAANSWTSLPPAPTRRSHHAAAVATNGKVYLMGGLSAAGRISKVEEFDPATGSWTTKASMAYPRYSLGAAATDKVYAVGGFGDRPAPLGSAHHGMTEEYDPVANTWTRKADMPTGRSDFGIAKASNGSLYAVGGTNGAALANVEAFDPASGTWTVMSPAPTARQGLGMAAVSVGGVGKLYAMGGTTSASAPLVEEGSLPSSATATNTPTLVPTAPPTSTPTNTQVPTAMPTSTPTRTVTWTPTSTLPPTPTPVTIPGTGAYLTFSGQRPYQNVFGVPMGSLPGVPGGTTQGVRASQALGPQNPFNGDYAYIRLDSPAPGVPPFAGTSIYNTGFATLAPYGPNGLALDLQGPTLFWANALNITGEGPLPPTDPRLSDRVNLYYFLNALGQPSEKRTYTGGNWWIRDLAGVPVAWGAIDYVNLMISYAGGGQHTSSGEVDVAPGSPLYNELLNRYGVARLKWDVISLLTPPDFDDSAQTNMASKYAVYGFVEHVLPPGPEVTPTPTSAPTDTPTLVPTDTPTPTLVPTEMPTLTPSPTPWPFPPEIDDFPGSLVAMDLGSAAGGGFVELSGPSTFMVHVGPQGQAPDLNGDGLDDVPTELVGLQLSGMSPMGPATMRLRSRTDLPFLPSTGAMEEKANLTTGLLDVPPFAPTGVAHSFFDVFFELEVGGQILHNNSPVRVSSDINHKPPLPGETYAWFGTPVYLFDPNGAPTDYRVNGLWYTPAGYPATPTPTPVVTEQPVPTETPTAVPMDTPTSVPVDTPTTEPAQTPTSVPTDTPTVTPTETPTVTPTETPWCWCPTGTPTATPVPPTATPTPVPGQQSIPLHAGWNWFSFAVAKAAGPTGLVPTPTAYFHEYWGAATINGQRAPVGAVVEAFNSEGVLVGTTAVVQEGYYGFMRVYGPDISATPGPASVPLNFKVNGYTAGTVPPDVMWQSGLEPTRVDLVATYALPVAEYLASISGLYSYVLGEEGTYAPGTPHLNTLHNLEPGKGYFIRMNAPATLTIEGLRLPVNTPMEIAGGWHWIGYLPFGSQGLPDALGSIEGRYDYLLGEVGTYAPFGPGFLNTLSDMDPGAGYVIRMRQGGVLIYGH